MDPRAPSASEVLDSLDNQEIDQMHAVALEFSKRTQESKKLAVTLVGVAASAVLAVTDGQLTRGLFPLTLVVLLVCWWYDSVNYYEQLRARHHMWASQQQIRERHGLPDSDGVGHPPRPLSRLGSFTNQSQAFYLALALLSIALWLLFELEVLVA